MLAFIDCFLETPANHCVNYFVEKSNIPATYHMVSKYGFDSLNALKNPTAFIILGSAAHVSDNPTWQNQLAHFIDAKLKSNIPVLGICYGHQLMANFYGSQLGYIFQEKTVLKEAREVSINKAFWNYPETNIKLAFAHGQIVTTLSDQFEELASSIFPNEIIKHVSLPFFGVQAHPEASLNFLKSETEVDSDEVQTLLLNGHDFIINFYNYSKSILTKN